MLGQWVGGEAPEAIRVEPATAAASRAGLCCSADVIGDGFRCRAGMLEWAGENRDGLRCWAAVWDTASLRSGAVIALGGHPGCWPGRVLRPAACGRAAVQGDGITGRWLSRPLVLLAHHAAPQTGIARLKQRQRHVCLKSHFGAGLVSPGPSVTSNTVQPISRVSAGHSASCLAAVSWTWDRALRDRNAGA